MKTLLCMVAATFVMFACTKTSNKPSGSIVTNAQESLARGSNPTNIITAHPWMYQGFYSHYVDEQHKGQRFYDRDSTNNLDQFLAA